MQLLQFRPHWRQPLLKRVKAHQCQGVRRARCPLRACSRAGPWSREGKPWRRRLFGRWRWTRCPVPRCPSWRSPSQGWWSGFARPRLRMSEWSSKMMMLIFLKQSRHCSTFALLLPVRLMLLPSIFSQMTPELTKNKPQVTCGSFWLLVNLLRTTSSKSIVNSIVNVIVLCHHLVGFHFLPLLKSSQVSGFAVLGQKRQNLQLRSWSGWWTSQNIWGQIDQQMWKRVVNQSHTTKRRWQNR